MDNPFDPNAPVSPREADGEETLAEVADAGDASAAMSDLTPTYQAAS